MSAGHFITGSSESVTTILNEHAEVFPEASVAMEFTVVVPTGNTDPEAGFERQRSRVASRVRERWRVHLRDLQLQRSRL